MRYWILGSLLVAWASLAFAQNESNGRTEAFTPPLDGIVEKKLHKQRRLLKPAPIREADIFWERRVSRVIDTREKTNQFFRYPQRPLLEILKDALTDGDLTAYHINEREDFSQPMTEQEVAGLFYNVDTVEYFDPETYKSQTTIVENDINADDIKRFRIKEVWYFDENTSSLNVRILAIAPLQEIYDNQGNFLYELPMCWVYMPHARELLARERVFNPGNDNAPMTWADIFDMRRFSSHIYYASNVLDRRLKGYLSGVDLLLESERIEQEIFNFEHDLWEP